MKNIILSIATLMLALSNSLALDWTYSTNLYYNLTYPTNIYMGTNVTDGATNGDTFYQWGTKLNGFMLLSVRQKAAQDATNATLAALLTNGITTNIAVIVPNSQTNTLYFTNGILRRVSNP